MRFTDDRGDRGGGWGVRRTMKEWDMVGSEDVEETEFVSVDEECDAVPTVTKGDRPEKTH